MRFRLAVVKPHRNGASNTGAKLAPKGKAPVPSIVERGKPFRFVKGDARINRKGRPRSFDELRRLAQKILNETVTTRDGEKLSGAEALLRTWATSREPTLQRALIEYGFGKVPDKIEATGLEGKTTLLLHFAHERTDHGDGDDRARTLPATTTPPALRQGQGDARNKSD